MVFNFSKYSILSNNTKVLNGPVPGRKTFQLMDEHAYCFIFHSTALTDDEDPLSKECE